MNAPYLLFTDAPPLKHGGHGCHVLSRNLITQGGDQFGLIITRRLSRGIKRENILDGRVGKTLLFPDLAERRLGRLRPIVELALFLVSLPRLRRAARESGASAIFALFGADPWFLFKVGWLRKATSLPLDIYLVDDLESSAKLNQQRLPGLIIRWAEKRLLGQCRHVFAISPGYAEHLANKYGVAAEWLPLMADVKNRDHAIYEPGVPDVRSIVFLGSISALYFEGLVMLHDEIVRWNSNPEQPYSLSLQILTRTEPTALLARMSDGEFIDLKLNLTDEELHLCLRKAWAIFLPYSFEASLRTMVKTSFSHKFTESVGAGRPILVYAPEYASLSKYFEENSLPLCVTNPGLLGDGLREIAPNDTDGLIQRYIALVEEFHSPERVRAILAGSF